ncbi:MAG TPA: transporter [Methylomirabilota bacterium]|nr:transporter [Methylomirabilota bacterium]
MKQLTRHCCRSLTTLLLTAAGSPALIAADAVDKSRFTLFNPTPHEHLRALSTDRPDKTESAYTVDAGHFQIEIDVVNYTHDHDSGGGTDTTVDAWAIAPINFKIGLRNNVDFQAVIGTYHHLRTEDEVAARRTVQQGFGDVVNRLKINLWGNDGGPTAMAVMPFIKYPTAQDHLGNSGVEGGVIIPLAVALPAGWGMGVMTELDIARDEVGHSYHAEFVNSITFARDIVGNLGGYVEFWSMVSTERGADWAGTFDVGLTYGLSDNIQLDAGINIGVTDSADDFNPFVGVSFRF